MTTSRTQAKKQRKDHPEERHGEGVVDSPTGLGVRDGQGVFVKVGVWVGQRVFVGVKVGGVTLVGVARASAG